MTSKLPTATGVNRVGDRGVQDGMNGNTTSSTKVRRRSLAAAAAIGVLAVGAATAAAADPAYGPDPTTPATEAAAAPATEAGTAGTADANAIVRSAETALGTVLVDNAGMTLYMFLNDAGGESTCTGECLTNWPAVTVEDPAALNVGDLDPALFSTVDNPEAGTMLKIGDWPLYRFAGDAAPGDVNGQAVGGVWWVVNPSGTPDMLYNTRETSAGPILVNAQGMTLYGFLNDTDGESTCVDDCATNWPPALIGDADPSLLAAPFSTVEHPTGTMLKVGDWPLYTFAGDAAPGEVNGQDVGEVWYAVAPDGSLVEGDITVAEMIAPSAPAGTAPAGTAPAGTAPATTG
jgi:predicted lipoprotein with Yx(FWY)xxD motif